MLTRDVHHIEFYLLKIQKKLVKVDWRITCEKNCGHDTQTGKGPFLIGIKDTLRITITHGYDGVNDPELEIIWLMLEQINPKSAVFRKWGTGPSMSLIVKEAEFELQLNDTENFRFIVERSSRVLAI